MLQQMVDMVVHQRPLEEGKEGEKTREEEKAREGEVHGVEVDVSGVPVVEEAGGQGERHSSEEPHDAPQRPSSDPSDAVHCHRCSSTNAVSDFEVRSCVLAAEVLCPPPPPTKASRGCILFHHNSCSRSVSDTRLRGVWPDGVRTGGNAVQRMLRGVHARARTEDLEPGQRDGGP